MFLMYRVELKDFWVKKGWNLRSMFLMYRVELKALSNIPSPVKSSVCKFLMYRVELKDLVVVVLVA